MIKTPKIALTIAGVDSGGACGLHPDIQTFTHYGAYALSAITALTAQNSQQIGEVTWTTPEFLAKQLELILKDYGCKAAKTGFIGNVALIKMIADYVSRFRIKNFVVDPVIANDDGTAMYGKELAQAYCQYLLPLALCITPNFHEASLLSGIKIKTVHDAQKATQKLHTHGAQGVLIKRIQNGSKIMDLFSYRGKFLELKSNFINTKNFHGTGDTFSAAITALLAKGEDLLSAVKKAHAYTQQTILDAKDWELGHGIGPINHFPKEFG